MLPVDEASTSGGKNKRRREVEVEHVSDLWMRGLEDWSGFG